MDAILDFFSSILHYLEEMIAGFAKVSSLLLDAGARIVEYLTYLPTGMVLAISAMITIIVSLAIVRWIT